MEPFLTQNSTNVSKCPHYDNVLLMRTPANTYLQFDPGRRLNMYIDDNNQRQHVPPLTELEQTALSLSVISMSIDKWSYTTVNAGTIKLRG